MHQKHTTVVKPASDVSSAQLNGLVLDGGMSSRMGMDKGSLSYHGMPQRDYMIQVMQKLVPNVFLSCHPDRIPGIDYRVIPDTYFDLGPYGGVLSAFRHDADCAWLVVACDLPLLDEATLTHLIEQRDPAKPATCFQDPATGLPEPLITIWEPGSYPILLQHLSQGGDSLRNVLINSDSKKVDITRPEVLRSANTKEEAIELRKILGM